MSLKDQLQRLSDPISASYAIDTVRRKSLVYEKPQSVDGLTCYHECIKAFNKLCEVDPELKRFNQTLFSTGTIKLEMSGVLPVHKRKIDEQVALFLFMINTHVRSSEAAWALEWLIYKYQIHLNYVEQFMMLLFPHYETSFFVKGIQLLDYHRTASEWNWLQPYAERGSPLSRMDFLKACRSQPLVIPFIGNYMATYTKYELALSLNRIQTAGSFFVSMIAGLCDAGLSDVKMAKAISILQGVIRKGLRCPEIPAFQSAAGLVVVRIALRLKLNEELAMDWIGCLLKKIRNGAEWESIRMISILMRTQNIVILPDTLSILHQNLLNSLSPLERALLDEEENKALDGFDVNSVPATSLTNSDRVQKATLLMDVSSSLVSTMPQANFPPTPGDKRQRKLTVKRVLKMTPLELFSSNSEMQKGFEVVHATLASGSNRICVMAKYDEKCSCPSTVAEKGVSSWLSDFVTSSALQFTHRNDPQSEETEVKKTLQDRQAKVALQIIGHVFDGEGSQHTPIKRSPRSRTNSLSGAKGVLIANVLDEALPCILVALIHPNSEVRVEAFDLIQRYIDRFAAMPPTSDFRHVTRFLMDLAQSGPCPWESVKHLLEGDTLPALVRTSSGFVQTVFGSLCRQQLEDSPISQACWFAASHLLHPDLLPCLMRVTPQSGQLVGWPAFIRLIRCPDVVKNGATHRACLDRLDALILKGLAGLPGGGTSPASKDSGLLGIAPREADLLDALVELAGSQTAVVASREINLPSIFSRLLLRAEHYVYCLAKVDATRFRNSSQSLFARVANARRNSRKLNKIATSSEDENTASSERSRLRALQFILIALSADIHRLQAEVCASQTSGEATAYGARHTDTPLSSAVSRLKSGVARRRSSVAKLNASGDGGGNGCGVEEAMKDLVFPLNSHLFACIAAETRFQRELTIRSRMGGRQRTLSTNSSIYLSDESTDVEDDKEVDEGIQDDVYMRPIPLSDGSNEETDLNGSRNGIVDTESNPGRSMTAIETANLREQSLSCAFESLAALTRLFVEGNKVVASDCKSKTTTSPLTPLVSVTTVMDTIFQCLSVFKENSSIQRQVMLCLIEMASLFPVVLCRNLITLVQWAGGNASSSSSLLRLDDVHNLSLLGRLISVAVPALVQASKHRVDAALRVLSVFVRGLPDLPPNQPRRALALYAGLLRGLAQVAPSAVSLPPPHPLLLTPSGDSTGGPVGGRKMAKQTALQGWLWTATLIFLKTEWPTRETADLVFPLLIDLYNQFDLPTQLASLHQCMNVFLHLINNPELMSPKQLHQSKRARLSTPSSSRLSPKSPTGPHAGAPSQEYTLLLKYLACPGVSSNDGGSIPVSSTSPPAVTRSRKRRTSDKEAHAEDVSASAGAGIGSLWSLLAETSGLFSALLSSAGHLRRRMEAVSESAMTDFGVEESFGGVVKLVVQLLVRCASPAAGSATKADETEARLTAVQNLQTVLVQMNSVMPNEVFLDCVARLMSLHQGSLTRKALELLNAKLSHLTAKCPSAVRLLGALGQSMQSSTAVTPKLEGPLERGLLNLFNQISDTLCRACTSNGGGVGGSLFSGDKTQAKLLYLRLSCLRELAQLLCRSHPDEMLRTIDVFLANQPSPRWWLRVSDVATTSKAGRLAASAAEARSMACLLVLECLARLPTGGQVTLQGSRLPRLRAQRILQFALDQASTACRLSDAPHCGDLFTVGKVHSREEHLQSGAILLLGAFEFCTAAAITTDNSKNKIVDATTESLLDRLRESDEEVAGPSKRDSPPPSSLDVRLLAFLFRTTHLDLSAATQAKVDRSTVSLLQSAAVIKRLRGRFVALPESLNLLTLTHNLIVTEAALHHDPNLLSGGLEFISRHADHVRSIAAVSDVDIDASIPGEGLSNSIDAAYASNPSLIWRLLKIALEAKPRCGSDAEVVAKAACSASASLLAVVNKDYQLQLVTECLLWVVQDRPPLPEIMERLSSLFAVLERLSVLISPEAFVSLVKNDNLINLFVTCLSLLAGGHTSRGVRKLASSLELPHFVDAFVHAPRPSATLAKATRDCLRSTLAATSAWLRAESELSACLDTAGTDAVLALPSALVQPLNAIDGVSEIDLVPCVAAFLKAVGGDEALLRPFGASLCSLVTRGTHWRTRLAALRLLKQTFDTLVSQKDDEEREAGEDGGLAGAAGCGGDLGLAACLVSDTLVALSEALEDDRPEVEAAANRLFADLEAAGATVADAATTAGTSK